MFDTEDILSRTCMGDGFVAYAWATAVGGLVPDAELAYYGPRLGLGCNVLAEITASPACAGLATYAYSGGVDDPRCLTVVPAAGANAPYVGLALGNAALRLAVGRDGASVGAAAVDGMPSFASSFSFSLSLQGAAAEVDLRAGVVTATGDPRGWSSTLVALRQYPNVVLQTLCLGDAGTVVHTLSAPSDGCAFAASFSAATVLTPGSNVLLRSVSGACSVGSVGSPDVGHALVRAAYVVPFGAAQPVERLVAGGGAYATSFSVAAPATVSVLVAHGLPPAIAARVLGAAADDLASGRLLADHARAEAACTRARVAVTLKAKAVSTPALVEDAAFHQLQLDAAVHALACVCPADVGLDADVWVVPPLLLTNPEAARPFVDARCAALPAAHASARERGFKGALFLEAGETDADDAYLPLFRTGLASQAAWNFFRASHDRKWLSDVGYALLQGAADLFVSAMPSPSAAAVPRVRGIDGVSSDDDPFTNVLAYLAVKNALEGSYELGFAGKAAWIAVFDATDTFGRHPLVAAVTAETAPLACWPLGFVAHPEPGPGTVAVAALRMGSGLGWGGLDAETASAALTGVARSAFLALRAQVTTNNLQAAQDAADAHAALTAAARLAVGRPWGVVRDPRVCGAYLLMHLSTFGQLFVDGGINRARYAYAPYAVPEPPRAGGVLPRHFASLAFYTGVEAGDFLVTNSQTFP